MAETSKVPDGTKEKILKATKRGTSDVIPGAPTAITGLPPPRHHTPDQCRAISAVPMRRGEREPKVQSLKNRWRILRPCSSK
jgi:hypothetical protein